MRASTYTNKKGQEKASLAFDSVDQAKQFVSGDKQVVADARKAVREALGGKGKDE